MIKNDYKLYNVKNGDKHLLKSSKKLKEIEKEFYKLKNSLYETLCIVKDNKIIMTYGSQHDIEKWKELFKE